jgi:colanic acid/amylovoran biosynthesis glycosyltransferase
MTQHKKIAIYSGDIPSTTFIERLIQGLSKTNHHVYLFGFLKKNQINYNSSVSVFGYQNTKIWKAFYLLKYSILLFFFKNKEKAQLDFMLKERSKNLALAKVKCYPVLWHKPDIFHLQWAKGLEDWLWVKTFGIKLVLSLRGAHINYSPIADKDLATMYRRNFPKVDAFHAVSKAIAKEAEQYGADKDKIKVVYSGLNLELKFTEKKKTIEVFKIVSIGRPHWIKGYTYALDACKILKASHFEFKYVIIGGADNIELAYQIQDLGLNDCVELMEQIPFDKVQEFIYHSDLLLLSSLKEGVANVVLEAMALNTLVLSTDCGGMNEAIIDGINGFLTSIRDSKSMAERIIQIAEMSEDEKAKVRKKGKEKINADHKSSHMVNGMLQLYESLY